MERILRLEASNCGLRCSSKHVLYILGLPGVGKTTVGEIIAQRTGYVLFDHNITYREVCDFLPKGTQVAHKLNGQIHLAVVRLLLHSGIPGVVCTMSVRRQPTDKTVFNAVQLIKKMGAHVDFVKLECDWAEHKRRVQMPSRKLLTKTNTIKTLRKYMKDPFDGLTKYPPIVINNTNLSANRCADKIISILGLMKRRVSHS